MKCETPADSSSTGLEECAVGEYSDLGSKDCTACPSDSACYARGAAYAASTDPAPYISTCPDGFYSINGQC